jgi:hypothetical protein
MSPFGDYLTYISSKIAQNYQLVRPNHTYPAEQSIRDANKIDLAKVRKVLEQESSEWHEKTIGVDANKIIAAIGRRKDSPQQNTVMQCKAQTVSNYIPSHSYLGASPTNPTVSQVAKRFGWPDPDQAIGPKGDWPGTSNYPSEVRGTHHSYS